MTLTFGDGDAKGLSNVVVRRCRPSVVLAEFRVLVHGGADRRKSQRHGGGTVDVIPITREVGRRVGSRI